MKQLRAQLSMEFSILVGMAFLMVIVFVAASANEIKEFTDQKEFFLVKDLALKLQKEVTIAASVEEGYKRIFNLPNMLESKIDYFITTFNTTITINSSKTVFSVRIPKVDGNFTKGSNKIEKINNSIFVNRKP